MLEHDLLNISVKKPVQPARSMFDRSRFDG